MVSGLEVIVLLLKRGFITEAMAQFRVMIEAMVRICALTKTPELIEDYLMQDYLFRGRVLQHVKNMRASWTPDMPREPSDEELDTELASVNQRKAEARQKKGSVVTDINLLDWAEKGGVLPFVWGHYPIASQAVHHGPRDLEQQISLDDEGMAHLVWGPILGNVENLVLTACKFLFVALEQFARAMRVNTPANLDALYDEYSRAFEILAERELAKSGK